MKNVLFISYYFPPSGGSGVQRGLKFVKYLRDFGWNPVVLTVDPKSAAYPEIDEGLLEDIPDGVTVVRTDSWDPYAAYASLTGKKKSDAVGVGFLGADHDSWKEKVARFVRANLFLPDARIGWVRHARRAAEELVKTTNIDAIVSTGPPHSAHLIAESIAKSQNLPWIADIRDAWPDIAYADMLPTTKLARRWDLRIRNRVLRSATVHIAVTDSLARQMSEGVSEPFRVIRNGFDPGDFTDSKTMPLDGFNIVHTGSMALARNPSSIWRILSRPDAQTRWPHLKLTFVGNVDGTVFRAASDAGLSHLLDYVSHVSHEKAIAYTRGATLLLLPINRVSSTAGIVTGKIYEYLRAGRPVLGLGDPEGESSSILRDTGAGSMFDYDDLDAIAQELDRHYAAWSAGSPLGGASPGAVAPYSRREQTRQLASLLDGILDTTLEEEA